MKTRVTLKDTHESPMHYYLIFLF